jgi:hypothetical protein
MPEGAQAEQVLQDSPGGAALQRSRPNPTAYQDAQAT